MLAMNFILIRQRFKNYLKMRERYGDRLTKDCFLIREQFDVRDPFAISRCKKVKGNTLTRKLIDRAERSLLRKKEVLLPGGNKKRSEIRKDVPIVHGFRKFFTSQLVEADLKTELRWLLEGHNLKGNDSNYVRVSEKSQHKSRGHSEKWNYQYGVLCTCSRGPRQAGQQVRNISWKSSRTRGSYKPI
jgi:hypothetical protein